MARILIAGCGYVGTRLAGELVAKGHAVFGLRRRPEALPSGVQPIAADLNDPAGLRVALTALGGPSRLDAVVYAAAADRGDDAAYRAAYVEGPSHLLGALQAAGERPRRILFTSSTGVYAQTDGTWVDEDSPTEPDHFTGQRVLEGERVVESGGLAATVVRLGGIYGPGRTRLVERVRSGQSACRAGPPRYTNRIHRDDAAGALRHLLELELAGRTPAPVYVGVDCEPADEGAVLRWLAQRLGVPRPPVIAAAEEEAPPGARARGSKRCRNARLLASGYRFLYPTFREGYGALIEADERAATGFTAP